MDDHITPVIELITEYFKKNKIQSEEAVGILVSVTVTLANSIMMFNHGRFMNAEEIKIFIDGIHESMIDLYLTYNQRLQ